MKAALAFVILALACAAAAPRAAADHSAFALLPRIALRQVHERAGRGWWLAAPAVALPALTRVVNGASRALRQLQIVLAAGGGGGGGDGMPAGAAACSSAAAAAAPAAAGSRGRSASALGGPKLPAAAAGCTLSATMPVVSAPAVLAAGPSDLHLG
jgi:hypothetical protein